MATAEVKIVFRINVELVSDFIERMQEHAETLADGYRCKAVSHEDMRCEGIDGHSGDRHSHGRFSWPVAESKCPPHLWVTARGGDNQSLGYHHCRICGHRRPF